MNIFVTLFAGVFMIIGFCIAFFGFKDVQKAQVSSSWPLVSGVITKSQIKESRGSRGGSTYRPDIAYTFALNGETFTGNVIAFGGSGISSGDRTYSDKCLAKYPLNISVQVAVNLDKPTESALEPGLVKRAFLGVAFGTIFFGAGFSIWLLCWLSSP
jgi:hypothetical protein